jgi:hypothetical protein
MIKPPHHSKLWSILGVTVSVAGAVAPVAHVIPGPVGIAATIAGSLAAGLGKGLLAPGPDKNQLQNKH